ncbi:MAG: hypothetical protein ACK481_05615 [Candidatus Melainabacteria bacterium]|jgi:hypothetical protein
MKRLDSSKFKALLFTVLIGSNLCLASLSADYCAAPIDYDFGQSDPIEFIDGAFDDPKDNQPKSQDKVSGMNMRIVPGARIPMTLDRALGSGFSRMGEIAYGRLMANQAMGIPQGTIAEIVVMNSIPGERPFAKPGQIQLGVNRLILPSGESIWLGNASVSNMAGQSVMSGAQKNRFGGNKRLWGSIGKVALGSGAGALAGLAIGAAGKAQNMGGAGLAGAGIGLLIGGFWAASSKGQDITLQTGTPINLSVMSSESSGSMGARMYP